MKTDKLLHLLACFAVSTVVFAVCHFFNLRGWAMAIAASLSLLVGVAKEIYDAKHPEHHSAEWRDFIADCGGIVLAAIPQILILL